jgi:HK97 family phage portal protein
MLGSLFRSEERAVQAVAWGDWGDGGAGTWAGVRVDSTNATQLLTVYGCVRLIADQVSTLPAHVYNDAGQVTAPPWLEYPLPGVHRVSWLTQILSSVLLDGNAWIMVLRSNGQISSLPVIADSRVTLTAENSRRVVLIDGQPTPSEVLHIPGLMLAGSNRGVSPVEAARQSIGAGMAAQEFGSRFFAQGANLGGVIEDPGEFNPDKAKEWARQWTRKHSGRDKSHLPGVLQGGASWKPTGVTNEQAQFLQTRQFGAAEIAGQMFLLDPSDLGIPVAGTSLTYASLEQRNQRRVEVALMPWIIRLEMALSSLLARPRYVKFNLGQLLRGDTKTRYEAYQIAIQSGFMLPNEAREFEDWKPFPEPAAQLGLSTKGSTNGRFAASNADA